MDFLVRLWWVRLPRTLRRAAHTPALALADGLYLTAFPRAAALLPPAALALGLAFGAPRLGYEHAFSESLPLLVVAALVGVLSAHLGSMFLAGFALGDLLLHDGAWLAGGGSTSAVPYFFSHVIEYALLAMLLVQIPLLTKALLVQCYAVLRLGERAGRALALSGHVALSGALVFYWGQVVPFLIRPVFVWNGMPSPPKEAMQVLQGGGVWVVVAAAALASAARMALQMRVALSEPLSDRLGEFEEAVTEGDAVPFAERLPRVFAALISAAWGALMLSGLYDHWVEAPVVAAAILALYLIRLGVIPLPLAAWSRRMNAVPLLLRLAVHVLVIWGAYALLTRGGRRLGDFGNSFVPMLALIVFAIVLLFVLNPGLPDGGEETGGRPTT